MKEHVETVMGSPSKTRMWDFSLRKKYQCECKNNSVLNGRLT